MTRIARSVWTAAMFGVLVAGVQTLTASPAGPADPPNCVFCYDVGDGLWMCYHMACEEA